jgi:hypothetical protein
MRESIAPIQPENEEFDHFRVLANETLFLTHPNISKTRKFLSTKNYCIIPSLLLCVLFYGFGLVTIQPDPLGW